MWEVIVIFFYLVNINGVGLVFDSLCDEQVFLGVMFFIRLVGYINQQVIVYSIVVLNWKLEIIVDQWYNGLVFKFGQ